MGRIYSLQKSEGLNDVTAQSAHTSAHGQNYANVLGVNVSAVNMSQAVALADQWICSGPLGYVCLTGVHGVMEAQRDPMLRKILNGSMMNLPDGMPMSWIGHLQGLASMDRVFGPDFMLELCRLSLLRGYRHFLYGGQPGVVEDLKRALEAQCIGLQIVGVYTPPFRPLTLEEEEDLAAQIHSCRPDIIWVGLSTPKQERFMAQYLDRFQVPLLVGVGAAFDYHTGRIRDCPAWVKRSGLQWLHRLMQDPKRLWRRYLRNNPMFVGKIILQQLKLVRYPSLPPRTHAGEQTPEEQR